MGLGSFFKRIFGWFIGGVKFVFAHTEIDEFVVASLGQVVAKAQELALDHSLSNADKKAALVAFVVSLAKGAKLVISDHIVNLLVELAVAKLKGTITEG